MTDNKWRVQVTLNKEQEAAVVALRKTDKYCRSSFGRILVEMIEKGIEVEANKEREGQR